MGKCKFNILGFFRSSQHLILNLSDPCDLFGVDLGVYITAFTLQGLFILSIGLVLAY